MKPPEGGVYHQASPSALLGMLLSVPAEEPPQGISTLVPGPWLGALLCPAQTRAAVPLPSPLCHTCHLNTRLLVARASQESSGFNFCPWTLSMGLLWR